MTPGAPWSEQEIERLIHTVERRLPLTEIARQLGRSQEDIEYQAFHLALAIGQSPTPERPRCPGLASMRRFLAQLTNAQAG